MCGGHIERVFVKVYMPGGEVPTIIINLHNIEHSNLMYVEIQVNPHCIP